MKKYIPIFIVVLLVVAVVLLTNKGPSDTSPIVLGFSSALSGDAASWGEGTLAGAKIAVEEANAQGGVNGRVVRLEVEDDRCDPKEGVSALNRLLLKNPHAIIGTVCSSPTIAILPLTEEKKLVFVSAGASSPKLTDMGEYFFRVYPSDSYPASLVGEYAVKKLGYKTFASLTIQNEYGLGLKNSFLKGIEPAGGRVTVAEEFPLNASDFRTQLAKIKQSEFDALYIGSNPKEFPLIVKQVKEAGIETAFLGDGVYIDTEEGRPVWNLIRQAYFTSPQEPETKVWKRVQEAYKKQYNKDGDFLVQIGYDSVKVVLEAIDRVGTDSDKIKEYLYNLKNYEGAGGMLTFDRNGDVQKPFQIKEIKNGEANVVE